MFQSLLECPIPMGTQEFFPLIGVMPTNPFLWIYGPKFKDIIHIYHLN